jgi:tetratricopeptide (TPR) repeat protein
MDEWHVGDPADWGDSVGVPDIPYMGYLQDDDEDGEKPPRVSKSDRLRSEAWRLRQDGHPHEALDKINEALEYSGHWRLLNVKAIILEDLGNYDEALRFYDKALAQTNAQFVRDNKARLLESIAWAGQYSDDIQKALDNVNQALKLTGDDDDRCTFFRTKAGILSRMGRKREAYVCYKLANRQPDRVDEFERQLKVLKETKGTLVCITGRNHYGNTAPTGGGAIVDLVKEPQNEHDSDAIRVEYQKSTVGYIANSPYTLIDEAKSATEIKGLFESRTKARILFVFMEEHLIAELL